MTYYPVIQAGDILMRSKALGVVTHLSAAVSTNVVLHNTPERGEHIASVEEFAAGQTVTVKRTGVNPFAVVDRARKILARPQKYHPVARNCEHTVYEVIYGVAKSPQFIFWAVVMIVVGIIVYGLAKR